MDKYEISGRYDYYKGCNMDYVEFNKELVYQKLLHEKYQNILNLLIPVLTVLLSISLTIYTLTTDFIKKMDILILGVSVILGILFVGSYIFIRIKQDKISLNINVLNEFKSNIITDSKRGKSNDNMNEVGLNQMEIGFKEFIIRIKEI